MSKLDDVLLKFAPTDSMDAGMVDPQWEADEAQLKQTIKDLMLELIDEDVSVPSDYASPKSEMWQAMGRNREKRELRQEIENL